MNPENEDLEFDLYASQKGKDYTRLIAAVSAVVIIAFIVLTVTTNIASRIVPMRDEYLQVLVPVAADGGEPLSLKSLEHEIMEKTITVRGSVMNRTEFPVTDLRVVLDVIDTTGRFGQVVELPLNPPEVPSQGISSFESSLTLQEKPAGYTVKFKLADGPMVPHKDEREPTFPVPGS